jgi:hypothetical protein
MNNKRVDVKENAHRTRGTTNRPMKIYNNHIITSILNHKFNKIKHCADNRRMKTSLQLKIVFDDFIKIDSFANSFYRDFFAVEVLFSQEIIQSKKSLKVLIRCPL